MHRHLGCPRYAGQFHVTLVGVDGDRCLAPADRDIAMIDLHLHRHGLGQCDRQIGHVTVIGRHMHGHDISRRCNQRFQRIQLAFRLTVGVAVDSFIDGQMHLVIAAGGQDDIAVPILNDHAGIGRQRVCNLFLGLVFIAEHLRQVYVIAQLQLVPDRFPIHMVMRREYPCKSQQQNQKYHAATHPNPGVTGQKQRFQCQQDTGANQ